MLKVSALVVLVLILLTACGPSGTGESTQASDPATTPEPTGVSITAAATSAVVVAAQQSATPFVFPPVVASAPICDNAPATTMILHERGQVTSDDPQPLNVREDAGLSAKIVGRLETNEIFMVIDGPRCADDYTWYQVRAGNVEGWVAEGDDLMYYIQPYDP